MDKNMRIHINCPTMPQWRWHIFNDVLKFSLLLFQYFFTKGINLRLTIHCTQCWRVLLGWWWENEQLMRKRAEVTLHLTLKSTRTWLKMPTALWLEQMNANLNAWGSYLCCQLCWYHAVLLETLLFNYWKEGNRKKNPHSCTGLAHTWKTITKLGQWSIAISVLVYRSSSRQPKALCTFSVIITCPWSVRDS